ncbi:MAG TPA: SLC13 family permease [Egicoccus sp.]|nr:SLC13 family permease [Egicoccus sp.]HSK22847.1 SLC13 family permease [Egicoccus sp.]
MSGASAWIAAGIVLVLVVALATETARPPAAMLGALVACVLTGVLPVDRAFVGFANPATIAVAGLFVVARAMRERGGVDAALARVLGNGTGGAPRALARFVPPVILLSGVVNNTPLVAAGAPAVRGWADDHGVAASHLLMPLSFAAILGGSLTLIGTAPNLVVAGLLSASGEPSLGFFTFTPAALPLAVTGGTALVLLAPRLLPERLAQPDPVAPEAASGHPGYRALTLATFAGMVVAAASGVVPVATAVLGACAVLVLSRTIPFARAVEAIDLDIVLVVAAAIGLGEAVTASGLGGAFAGRAAALAATTGPVLALAVVVLATLALTEVVTNVAAAALMLPVAVDVAARVGVPATGYAVAVAVAASSSFLTPVGYQTNTIVYGLGGYRFGDYWRLGLPMAALSLTTILLVVPRVWG